MLYNKLHGTPFDVQLLSNKFMSENLLWYIFVKEMNLSFVRKVYEYYEMMAITELPSTFNTYETQ